MMIKKKKKMMMMMMMMMVISATRRLLDAHTSKATIHQRPARQHGSPHRHGGTSAHTAASLQPLPGTRIVRPACAPGLAADFGPAFVVVRRATNRDCKTPDSLRFAARSEQGAAGRVCACCGVQPGCCVAPGRPPSYAPDLCELETNFFDHPDTNPRKTHLTLRVSARAGGRAGGTSRPGCVGATRPRGT